MRNLEKKSILKSETRGKIKIYKITPSFISREYLLLTENYKKIAFLEKNIIIKEIVEKIESYIDGISLIFGSYAKGTYKKDSDLDIFVAGSYKKNEINKISNLYNIEINIKQYDLTAFENNLHKDIFLREILDNHIIIKGTEEFLGMMVRWIK